MTNNRECVPCKTAGNPNNENCTNPVHKMMHDYMDSCARSDRKANERSFATWGRVFKGCSKAASGKRK